MEKLKHVKPTKQYEKQAIEFINEFYQYNSEVNGSGGLDRFLDNYDGWLEKLEEDRTRKPNEEKVPAETFFLIREKDDKIVGMINIRLALNEILRKTWGHIGYCIRPTERRKGYNKVNLYLALQCCQEHNIKEVLLECDKINEASRRTMQALGGIFKKEFINPNDGKTLEQHFTIDVDKALEDYKELINFEE